jgi:hypothetical protein
VPLGCGTDGGVMHGRLVGGSVTVVVSSTVVGGAVGSGTVTVGPGGPGGPVEPGGRLDGPGPAVVVAVVATVDGVMVGAARVVGATVVGTGACAATAADTPTSSSTAGIHR